MTCMTLFHDIARIQSYIENQQFQKKKRKQLCPPQFVHENDFAWHSQGKTHKIWHLGAAKTVSSKKQNVNIVNIIEIY